MREFDHTVRSVVGLHPRVAGVMMHLVRDFESDVILTDGDRSGNLRKLLGILHMNIREGDKLPCKFPGRMRKWPIRNCRHLCHRIYNGPSFIEDRRWEREW